jgi:hypothetical protein
MFRRLRLSPSQRRQQVPVVKHRRHTSSTPKTTNIMLDAFHSGCLSYTLRFNIHSRSCLQQSSIGCCTFSLGIQRYHIISSWGIIRTVVRHDNQSHALMDILQASHNSPTSLRAVSTMLIQVELGTSRMLQRSSIALSSYPTCNQQKKVQSFRSSISSLSPHRLPTMS